MASAPSAPAAPQAPTPGAPQNPNPQAPAQGTTQTPTPAPANFTSDPADNTGGSFDATSFWNSDDPAADPASTGPDATAVRDNLNQQLAALDFGTVAFDAETVQQINDGNFEGINKRLQDFGTNAVKQSLALTVSILQPLTEQILGMVDERINGTLSGRDDSDQLVRDFPTAKDPKIRPVIDNLYKQALKNTKGDRGAAVEQVKSMLTLVNQSTADDLGLEVAPRGAEDFGRSRSPAVNWLDTLSGRS